MRAPASCGLFWVYVLAMSTRMFPVFWFVVIIIPFFFFLRYRPTFFLTTLRTWMYAKPWTVMQSVATRQHLISYLIRASAETKIELSLFRWSHFTTNGIRLRDREAGPISATASAQRVQPYDGMKQGRFKLIWYCGETKSFYSQWLKTEGVVWALWVFQLCDLTRPMFWHIFPALIGLVHINRFLLCFQRPIWHAEQ